MKNKIDWLAVIFEIGVAFLVALAVCSAFGYIIWIVIKAVFGGAI